MEEHKEELEAEMAREQATYDVALQLVKAGVRRAVHARVTPIRMCRRKIQMSASSHRLIRLGRQTQQRVACVALAGHRPSYCHLCSALRRQVGCFRPGLSFVCDAAAAAAVPAASRVAPSEGSVDKYKQDKHAKTKTTTKNKQPNNKTKNKKCGETRCG